VYRYSPSVTEWWQNNIFQWDYTVAIESTQCQTEGYWSRYHVHQMEGRSTKRPDVAQFTNPFFNFDRDIRQWLVWAPDKYLIGYHWTR